MTFVNRPPVYLVRAALLMAFMLTCVSLGFGQKYCAVPESRYKHSALVVSRYDKSAGRMKTVLEYPPLDVKRGDRFTMSAFFFHHDVRLREMPTLNMTFTFVSREADAQHSHDFSFFINGRPLSASVPAQYAGKHEEHGYVIEAARLTLSFEELQEIINGRSVEVRLGALNYRFSEDNLEALREIASQIAPYAQWARKGTSLNGWNVR